MFVYSICSTLALFSVDIISIKIDGGILIQEGADFILK